MLLNSINSDCVRCSKQLLQIFIVMWVIGVDTACTTRSSLNPHYFQYLWSCFSICNGFDWLHNLLLYVNCNYVLSSGTVKPCWGTRLDAWFYLYSAIENTIWPYLRTGSNIWTKLSLLVKAWICTIKLYTILISADRWLKLCVRA